MPGKFFAITVLPETAVLQANGLETLLESLNRAGVAINQSCGGNGTCGTCRVKILSSERPLLPRNEIERQLAQDRDFDPAERLSCQIHPNSSLKVEIPETRDIHEIT